MRSRRRYRSLPVVAGLMLGALTLSAPAHAGSYCSRSGNTMTITLPPEGADLEVSILANGDFSVTVNGVAQDCEGSKSNNTQLIIITGSDAADNVFFDGGGPGGTLDPNTILQVGLGNGTDVFVLRGTKDADKILIGTVQNGGNTIDVVDPHGDCSPNIDLGSVEGMTRAPSGGNDVVTGKPACGAQRRMAAGGTSMGPARLPLILKGGPGNDKLTGGTANDTLIGAVGNDKLKGLGGKDTLKGGGGDDTCKGGPGSDKIKKCE